MMLGLFQKVSCVVTFAVLAQPLLVLGTPFFLIGQKLLLIILLVLLAACLAILLITVSVSPSFREVRKTLFSFALVAPFSRLNLFNLGSHFASSCTFAFRANGLTSSRMIFDSSSAAMSLSVNRMRLPTRRCCAPSRQSRRSVSSQRFSISAAVSVV